MLETYVLVGVISLSLVALVDEVHGVPAEVNVLVCCLGLAISMELFVAEHVHVDLNCWLEALLLHPLATIAVEGDRVTADLAQGADDLGANEISLAGVGQEADSLDVSGGEAALSSEVAKQHIPVSYTHLTLPTIYPV